jgi:hypothetical protein
VDPVGRSPRAWVGLEDGDALRYMATDGNGDGDGYRSNEAIPINAGLSGANPVTNGTHAISGFGTFRPCSSGDSTVDPGEMCDGGNTQGGDECPVDCLS